MLKKFLHAARFHHRLSIAVLVVVFLLLGVIALSVKATRESDARKSPEALLFEKAPDGWLTHQKSIAEFRNALNAGNLSAVGLDSAEPGLVLYTLKSGEKGSTVVPGCTMLGCAGTALDSLGDKSAQAGFALVRVEVDPRTASRRLLDILTSLLSPMLLLVGCVGAFVVSIQLQRGMGGAASRLAIRPKTQFTDAIGQQEAKSALNRVKAFMQDPVHYANLGAVAPRGVLLVGPPGTGKTLLAKALAGESKANFISVDGSYFTATYYGAGVAKVKALFKLARKNAPCVRSSWAIGRFGSALGARACLIEFPKHRSDQRNGMRLT